MSGDHRICFIGDSYIQGTSDPECLGWVGRVSARARQRGVNLSCYNLGVRRETSADIATRWQEEVRCRFRPTDIQTYLVFSFGINDCTVEDGVRRVAEHETLEHMGAILELASQQHRTVFIGPAPIAAVDEDTGDNERIGQLSRRMAQVAAASNVPYLELFAPLLRDPGWMAEIAATDGSHPSAPGYRKLADMVEGWDRWWFPPAARNRR